jgi:hypothetical protein
VRQFKLSNDRQFASKLRDIVGLYVDPPAHAVVLSQVHHQGGDRHGKLTGWAPIRACQRPALAAAEVQNMPLSCAPQRSLGYRWVWLTTLLLLLFLAAGGACARDEG